MEEKKLHCLKCGGDMKISGMQALANCADCDSLNPMPLGIFQTNEKNVEWLIERYNKAIEYNMTYQFHRAYNVYDKICKSYTDGYAYWGKVLSQYGVVYHLDHNLTNQMIVLRTQYERIFENENYQKALELLDEHSGALIKNEAIQIDRLCQNNLKMLLEAEHYDVTILVDDSDSNPNRNQDIKSARLIEQKLLDYQIKVCLIEQLWDKKKINNLEKTLFPFLELSPVLIAINTSQNEQNPIFKNSWIRFRTSYKEKQEEPSYFVGIGSVLFQAESTEKEYYIKELTETGFEEITNSVKSVINTFITSTEVVRVDEKEITEKLHNKKFDEVKELVKTLTSKNKNDYQAWWLALLAKYEKSSSEELKEESINCSEELFFQKAFFNAPTFMRRQYYLVSKSCLSNIESTPDNVYDQRLEEAQMNQYHLYQKRLWKPFIILWSLTILAFLTLSIKSTSSFLITFILFSLTFIYVTIECVRVERLGKIPRAVVGELNISKYYQHLRSSLTPSQSAIYLPYQPFNQLKKRWRFFLTLSIVIFSVFLIKEVAIAIQNWDLQYTYHFNQVIITGGDGEEIIIPSTIGGRKVIRVRRNAFKGDKEIKSIFIEEGIKELGNSAFANCPSLQMIQLPETLNKVGEHPPFKGCNQSVHLFYPGSLYLSELFGRGYDTDLPGLDYITEK